MHMHGLTGAWLHRAIDAALLDALSFNVQLFDASGNKWQPRLRLKPVKYEHVPTSSGRRNMQESDAQLQSLRDVH